MDVRPVRPLYWLGDALLILDQTRLPSAVVYRELRSVDAVAEAIRTLRVRGAPAIGIAAAYGVAIGLLRSAAQSPQQLLKAVEDTLEKLAATRPTARNLFWALERMRAVASQVASQGRDALLRALTEEAHRILEEERAACQQMARWGADLLPEVCTVITHCNAGALATIELGTAVGVIYAAAKAGKKLHVFVDETRPLLQGARLTAWELRRAGLNVTLICDNTAAFVMARRRVDAVLVGADRIARNGDVANKIGTYNLALLAKEHGVPFYVVAPSSTFDLRLASGQEIPIEERDGREVTHPFGIQVAPTDVEVYNPAFDITPAHLIRAIVTERGVIFPPFEENIPRVLQNKS
ncbi:MAG: S-methyl-5-thioribose-1-phosphate isomerase [candidate division KSB1 bacterium]|nr:S-methyl-5-thioribose-1-phosphate isomerase [candidate division KSB1 bacterium]